MRLPKTKKREIQETHILMGLIVLFAGFFLLIAFHPAIADEVFHVDQILRFARGDFSLNPAITQIPGYHALIALPAWLTGLHSLPALRFFSFFFAVGSISVFYAVAQTIDTKNATLRTLQYAFLPILFPYIFLVYTDIVSLLFILLALLCVLHRQAVLAGFFLIAAFFLRQDNILWAAFLWIVVLLLDTNLQPAAFVSASWRERGRTLLRVIRSTWSFLLLLILFAAFVRLNHGVAIGDRGAHPFPSFHLGNVYFLLFLTFFLFLPIHIANIPRFASLLRGWRALVFPALFILAYIFLFTFVNDHPDNQAPYLFFLRNQLLIFFTSSVSLKLLFFVPVAFSILSLCVTALRRPFSFLLYPATFLFLTSSWLIEQRYYVIPLTLFLLTRKHRHDIAEYLMVALSLCMSLSLFAGIAQGQFFL